MEENIFKYPPKKYLEDIQKIHVTQENSPDSEIENVAKEILNKIQKENYRYENIAILTKNIDSYKTLFNRIFKNYNIPYFFDDKKELAMQPLLTLVLSLFDIISKNHFNSNPKQWHCDRCETYDLLNGSYIAFVEEEDFLKDPQRYIDNAYDKSENDASGYDLVKQR